MQTEVPASWMVKLSLAGVWFHDLSMERSMSCLVRSSQQGLISIFLATTHTPTTLLKYLPRLKLCQHEQIGIVSTCSSIRKRQTKTYLHYWCRRIYEDEIGGGPERYHEYHIAPARLKWVIVTRFHGSDTSLAADKSQAQKKVMDEVGKNCRISQTTELLRTQNAGRRSCAWRQRAHQSRGSKFRGKWVDGSRARNRVLACPKSRSRLRKRGLEASKRLLQLSQQWVQSMVQKCKS